MLFLLVAGRLAATYAGRSGQRPTLQRAPGVNAIAGWMTLSYIARVYGVPEQALLSAVQLTAPEARRRSLRSIARSQHQPLAHVIASVQAAVLASRRLPTPTSMPPKTLHGIPLGRPPGSG